MSRLVLHVDTAATWRGGQNQVLLTAQGMAARGDDVTIACRAGGELEARARAAGVAVQPGPVPGRPLAARDPRARPRASGASRRSVLLLHDPHAVSAGLVAARLAAARAARGGAARGLPAARRAVAGEVRAPATA